MRPQIPAVCPDDLGELDVVPGGVLCRRCSRLFPMVDEILELLPRVASLESSPEATQMNAYRATFSNRSERDWRRPFAVFMNTFGNGYLYAWAARALENLSNGRSQIVLDAACGEGSLRRYLPHKHFYIGVDFSTRVLARAKRYNTATYFRADLKHLPFLNATFDTVFSLQALQYLERPEVALAQIARVLKPDGRLVLTVPNNQSFKYRFQGIPGIQLQQFDGKTLPDALARSFDILESRTQGIWLPIPKIPVHVPGTYPATTGLSWTVVAKPRK
jgi:SAM-dependent methyltransferase